MQSRLWSCWGCVWMNKWTKAAKARLTKIQADESAAADMRAMAEAFAKLPHGQLKKIMTDDIIAILAKYWVVIK